MPARNPLDVQIIVRASERERPTLRDLNNFLYDFNLAYEISRLATDPRYEGFTFSRFVFYRDGRPLEEQDRIRVDEITKRSPLALELAIVAATPAAVGAIWGIVQIVEKVSNWRLNRRKLEAEVKKLESDVGPKQMHVSDWNEETFQSHLESRNAVQSYSQVEERLLKSPVKIIKTEIIVKRTIITTDDAQG